MHAEEEGSEEAMSDLPPAAEEKPTANTVFIGTRSARGEPVVTANGKVLSPLPSQRVWNHSPDGFEWGYGGSGPAQLALALLLAATANNTVTALSLYQTYKWQVVARWPKQGWATTRQAILRWILDQTAPLEPFDGTLPEVDA